jgi:hypothetical protein
MIESFALDNYHTQLISAQRYTAGPMARRGGETASLSRASLHSR